MSGPATPFAPASLPPTGSATPALPPQPTAPALPPPADFDILPDLHKLLARVVLPDHDPDKLQAQHVDAEANKIKLKIQKARRAVLALPDVDRTIEDQQEEIEDLEARIARLKAALQGLGQPSKEADEEDTSMTG